MSDCFHDLNNQNAYAELDQTLRRLAHAPVPEGLEERVKARLVSSPRQGKLLAWPVRAWTASVKSDWLRTAAAAAIVAVVAGGGWGVAWHIARQQAGNGAEKGIVAHVQALGTGSSTQVGGISSAGAMRVPLSLNGPTVNHAVKNAVKKHPGKSAKMAAAAGQGGQATATGNSDQVKSAQVATPAAAK